MAERIHNNGGESLAHQRDDRQRSLQDRAKQTVRRLIDATVAVLAGEGETAVTIERIANETGLSRGAIYHHFEDRDALVRAAQFDRLAQQPLGDIEALRAAVHSARTRSEFVVVVELLALAICDPSRHAVRILRAGVIGASFSHPDLAQAVRGLETAIALDLVEVIHEGQERGFVTRSLDAAAIAAVIESVAFGLLIVEFTAHQPERHDLAKAVSSAFLAFLAETG